MHGRGVSPCALMPLLLRGPHKSMMPRRAFSACHHYATPPDKGGRVWGSGARSGVGSGFRVGGRVGVRGSGGLHSVVPYELKATLRSFFASEICAKRSFSFF